MFVSAFRKLIPSTSRSQQTFLVQPFKAEKSKQYAAPKKLLDEVVGYFHEEKLKQNRKSIFNKAKSVFWKYLTGKSAEESFNEVIVDQRGNYAFQVRISDEARQNQIDSLNGLLKYSWTPQEYNALFQALEHCGGKGANPKFAGLIKALNEDKSGDYRKQLIQSGLSDRLVCLIKGLPLSTGGIKGLSLGCDSFSILLDKIRERSGVLSHQESLRQILEYSWTFKEYNALVLALEDCGGKGAHLKFPALIKALNEDESGNYINQLIKLGLSEQLV